MDPDRIEGSARTVGGRLKEFFGRLFGDAKMQADGKIEKAEGKVQNTIGGLKDTLRSDEPRRGP